jgi:hypothetical protein
MKSYTLVNPCILGQFNTEYKTENGLEAASQFWNDLSSFTTNNVPQLFITIQDKQSKDLLHFKISEKINPKTKVSDFTIEEYNINVSEKKKKDLLKGVEEVKSKVEKLVTKQTGGDKEKKSRKRYEDSSSSDSDSDDEYFNLKKYKRMTQPLSYWWYAPYIYNTSSIFIPTFNVPIIPYIELWWGL